jgi:hypothetical protein
MEKIATGRKTETRRVWKRPHVRIGGIYRTRRSRREPASPDDPVIRVTDLWGEPLGQIDLGAVKREGCDGLEEFVLQWQQLHGDLRPEQIVYVVRFEVLL